MCLWRDCVITGHWTVAVALIMKIYWHLPYYSWVWFLLCYVTEHQHNHGLQFIYFHFECIINIPLYLSNFFLQVVHWVKDTENTPCVSWIFIIWSQYWWRLAYLHSEMMASYLQCPSALGYETNPCPHAPSYDISDQSLDAVGCLIPLHISWKEKQQLLGNILFSIDYALCP